MNVCPQPAPGQRSVGSSWCTPELMCCHASCALWKKCWHSVQMWCTCLSCCSRFLHAQNCCGVCQWTFESRLGCMGSLLCSMVDMHGAPPRDGPIIRHCRLSKSTRTSSKHVTFGLHFTTQIHRTASFPFFVLPSIEAHV